MIWSYPRGGDVSKEGETAIDVGAYAAHMAACSARTSSRSSRPTDHLEQGEAKKVYEKHKIDWRRGGRVRHVVQCVLRRSAHRGLLRRRRQGRRRGLDDARAIRDGGGNGSIIGRNTFQRPREDALAMLGKLVEIYKGRA